MLKQQPPAVVVPAACFSGARPGAALGSPTGASVTVSLLSDIDLEAYLEYGMAPGTTGRTAALALAAGVPAEVAISALARDTAYTYRVRFRAPGASAFSTGRDATFHTQRGPGSTFTFTLDADPHNRDPDFNADVHDCPPAACPTARCRAP